MEVNEINPDWLLREIAKLNSNSHATIRQMHLEGMKKEILQILDVRMRSVESAEKIMSVIDNKIITLTTQLDALWVVHERFELYTERKLRELEEKMTKLTTKARKALPKKAFAEPAERKYPVEDKAHARNAKARASEMKNKGKISESTKEKIDAKANKVLKKGKK